MAYNIFISWAGPLSKKIAYVLHEWLPTVIQAADPFMSDKDIDAGARGLEEISAQLKNIQIGLICVTADNQSSAWLNFEAGALSKLVSGAYVIPMAFDVEKGQIKNPLGQFQAQHFSEDDVFHTVESINRALGSPLSESRLVSAFRLAWSDLITKIENLRTEQSQQTFIEEDKRSTEDMLDEVIVAIREQSSLIRNIEKPVPKSTIMSAQMEAANAALLRISFLYSKTETMGVKELLEYVPLFDDEDWRILETAPYLLWYVTVFKGFKREQKPQVPSIGDLDDVPF